MSRTTIYYSASEPEWQWDVLKKQCPNILMSYFYIVKKQVSMEARIKECPDIRYIVDSGAFSINNEHKWFKQEWEDYLKAYVDWVVKYRKYIDAVAELDVGSLVGFPIVRDWQEKYFHPLEKSGMQVIYVWHPGHQTLEGWERMCRQYSYVGLSNETFKERQTEKLMLTARRYRTKVHGFAITSYKAIRDYTMATADSTTWLARGGLFGDWCIWTGQKFHTIQDKADRPKFRRYIEDAGFNFDEMSKENFREACAFCLNQYRKMEEHYARLKGSDNYWSIRTPYPEIVKQLWAVNISTWLNYLGVDMSALPKYSEETVLLAISLLQNSRYEEYTAEAAAYNDILSKVMGIVVDIQTKESLDRVRDQFNSGYTVVEPVRARTRKVHFEETNPVQERKENEYDLLQAMNEAEVDTELKSLLEGDTYEEEPENQPV